MNIRHNNIIVGTLVKKKFKTSRKPEHILRKHDGFALSHGVLERILSFGGDSIEFTLREIGGDTTYTIKVNDFIYKGHPWLNKQLKKSSPNRFKPEYLYDMQVVCNRKFMRYDGCPNSQTTL